MLVSNDYILRTIILLDGRIKVSKENHELHKFMITMTWNKTSEIFSSQIYDLNSELLDSPCESEVILIAFSLS